MDNSKKLDIIIETLGEMKTEMSQTNQAVSELKGDVAVLKGDVAELKSDVAELKGDVAELKSESASHGAGIDAINYTLENDIHDSIMRIAEGHLDLDRALKENSKSNAELEMLSIRVGWLERKVRTMAEKD